MARLKTLLTTRKVDAAGLAVAVPGLEFGAVAGHTWAMLLKRPEVEIGAVLRALEAELVADAGLRPLVDAKAAAGEGQLASQPKNEARAVETEIKFAGYLEQQKKSIERLKAAEGVGIPEWLDYTGISGLSREMQEKLMRVRPGTIGQASRIPGVTPAALGLVHVSIKMQGKGRGAE
jgi:tRNA uridine 5-carboxymethylaminomethyl modification enzyme